jgi:restriction system protein
MTDLTKAGLLSKVAPKTYRATKEGVGFLATHPGSITIADLNTLPAFKAWKASFKSRTSGPDAPGNGGDITSTPMETIDQALEQLSAALRSKLLEAIHDQSPEFFEHLVLDVLVAMGYGGSRADAAKHLGQSNDEGIDGRINQDALGLDQILVQAKRYDPARKIDRKTVQAFIGSLAGQGVSKGVFITLSSFQESAEEFVMRGANTKVVLIDGAKLIELMMRHRIGVRIERQVEVLDIDQNYFSDED